jgi:NADH-quinone oxidoreductase subunit L
MMVAALGAGAYATAIFHVTTHAFFKALLFLAAGSVIHAMSGEQDVRRMGGLRKKLPITYLVFLIGTLAISGIPPFAGFFSKDEILAHMWVQNKILFVGLALTAVCTALYMFKLFFMTFYGSFRGTHEQEHHLHESPPSMTVPLIALAILSTIGGFLGIPEIFGGHHHLRALLAPLLTFPASLINEEPSHSFEWIMMGVTLLILALVIRMVYTSVVVRKQLPADDEKNFTSTQRLLANKYYVDEIYAAIVVKPLRSLANLFSTIVDTYIIDGAVRSVNTAVNAAGTGTRKLQTGNVGFYVFAMVLGIIAILVYNLIIR